MIATSMNAPAPDRLLKVAEVAQMTGQSRATIYNRLDEGTFPVPVRISPNAVRWRQSAVQAWIAALPPARE